MASPDLNQLFNEARGFAEYMLLAHGEFIPFGVSMNLAGEIAQVAGDLDTEHPESTEMIDLLQGAFRESAVRGSIRAAGVCIDMLVVPPGGTEKSDAICVRLAHTSGESVSAYVPYAREQGAYTFGQVFATPGDSFWLVEPLKTSPKASNMTRLLLLALIVMSFSANAIVIRDDVDDSKYRIPASEFPALVDMPGEGHGVLIAPQWVITAAHAITWQSEIRQVTINGVPRDVERLVIHHGYTRPPQELLDQALATWDWTLFRVLLSSSDDIALLKLARPVTDVSPVAINKSDGEFGQIINIIGKGATGNGITGYEFSSSHRTELRRAYNKATSAHGRWLCYMFDKPSDALPLEGGSGSGDSGGPILIQVEKDWLLAGLTSWGDPQSSIRTPGRYGQISCNVRLSYYKEWIESVVSAQP